MSNLRSPSNRVLTGAAADGELDNVLHVADVDAVARHFLAVDADPQLRLIGVLLNGGIGGAGNPAQSPRAPACPNREARRGRAR